jgi:uncharacterized protein (TIGR00730 family)
MKQTITMFCGSKDTCQPQLKDEIFQSVYKINPMKYQVAYGGGTTGYMGEIYRASVAKQITIQSVNCFKWKEQIDYPLYNEVCFNNIVDRQNHLLSLADIFIVFPGGLGTIFEAMQAITMNDVKETNKPILFLNYQNYFSKLFDMIDSCRQVGTVNKSNKELNIHIVNNNEELHQVLNQL